ncbi:PDR/VanB family oxidoreductase [Pseudonocardia sp. NPDC046786]|uniref:PDR/VanB family oxidoreductase n=1 Tax=Pseudonocardia sp. NPDC046786 TaxID=3155471 RepID=UPI0034044DC1
MGTSERDLVVRTITDEADGVVAIELADPADGALTPWTPGAHLDLLLPNGLTRQYSLCGDVDDTSHYRIGVLREPRSRGGSEWLHTALAVGDRLRARGPRNNFALDDAAHHVFVAGGIGVTPMLPMLEAVRRRGGSWQMVYGGRTRAAMAFLGELPPEVEIVPQDEAGHPDLGRLLDDPKPGTLVYCCGPTGLIEAVQQRCAGWADPDAVRYELFAAPATDDDTGDQQPFEVELAHTGTSFVVGPGESILARALEAGADIVFDCEDGICGSCETPILDGRADHRDHVLTTAEQDEQRCLMICVSRSATPRLVLDL